MQPYLNRKYIFIECFHLDLGDRVYIQWKASIAHFVLEGDVKSDLWISSALSLTLCYNQSNKQCGCNLDAQAAVSDSSHHAVKDFLAHFQ